MPYVWVSGADRDEIENALRADPTVEDIELISEQDHRWLYQMNWVRQICSLIRMLIEEDSTVLTAFGKGDRWDLRLLFPDREAVSRTYDFCRDVGLKINLQRIYDHDDSRAGQYDLTEDQEQALVTAFEQGFFLDPARHHARRAGRETRSFPPGPLRTPPTRLREHDQGGLIVGEGTGRRSREPEIK